MPTMTERLAQLHGTRAAGTIEINEVALNEMIGFAARGGTIPTIQLLDGNLLEVRYGVIYARAQLPPALETGPAPKLTVTLASRVVAWGLAAMLRSPFVEFVGRRVTVHLAAVPALAPCRALWPHLTSARLATVPGALRIGLGIAVDQGATHG
jgi:hypothetical protein